MKHLQCEMRDECPHSATHIEDKGYIYCATHAADRRSYGHRCRKMRPWELRLEYLKRKRSKYLNEHPEETA